MGERGGTINCPKIGPAIFPHCSANWFCNKLEGIWQDIQPEHGQCVGTKINNHEEVGSFSSDVSEVRPSCGLLLISLCLLSHTVVSSWTHSGVQLSGGPWTVAPARLLCPWNFLGKNTGVGCRFLLWGIFPTQGLNSRLLHLQHSVL